MTEASQLALDTQHHGGAIGHRRTLRGIIMKAKCKTSYRVRVIHDQTGQADQHDPAGEPLPGSRKTYDENPIMELINKGDDPVKGKRRRVTWDEYLAYYGNPDRHVVCGVLVDKLCPCCGNWDKGVTSLWAIDFMDDSPEVGAIDGPPVDYNKLELLPGYLREVATDLLREAGARIPKPKRG